MFTPHDHANTNSHTHKSLRSFLSATIWPKSYILQAIMNGHIWLLSIICWGLWHKESFSMRREIKQLQSRQFAPFKWKPVRNIFFSLGYLCYDKSKHMWPVGMQNIILLDHWILVIKQVYSPFKGILCNNTFSSGVWSFASLPHYCESFTLFNFY